MPFEDLHAFLAELERARELKRVRVEVDPELEVTEIAHRLVRQDGPAVLFENVKGAKYPLVVNTLASAHRIELALGMHPEEIGLEIVRLVERLNPPSLAKLWNERATVMKLLRSRPLVRRSGPVHEVVENAPNLFDMPILKCWPDDGGRFITLPLVMTHDPVTGVGNLGIYRMHVHDQRSTGIHIQIQKGGGFHYYRAEQRNEPLPVAVILGGDPALMLAAVMPLPEGIDELAFAGVLRNKRTKLVRARSSNMLVPANAEFILEGVMRPKERHAEGPFGDHFGHYSNVHDFPIFRVQQITRRRNPIYPAAIVGKPPQEDRYFGEAAQHVTLPFVRMLYPEIRDLWAYYETGFAMLVVVSVESRFTREHLKTALAILGQGQLSLTKTLVLVNPDVNVRDPSAVLQAIRENFEAREDFLLISRTPADTLDFATEVWHQGSKMVLDATGPGSPKTSIPLPGNLRSIAPDGVKSRLIGHTMLVVQVARNARENLEALVASPFLAGLKIIAVVSEDVDIENNLEVLWGIFTRFDPVRDLVFTQATMRGVAPVYEGVLGIDATYKDWYPKPIVMDPAIVEKVTMRWDEYWK